MILKKLIHEHGGSADIAARDIARAERCRDESAR